MKNEWMKNKWIRTIYEKAYTEAYNSGDSLCQDIYVTGYAKGYSQTYLKVVVSSIEEECKEVDLHSVLESYGITEKEFLTVKEYIHADLDPTKDYPKITSPIETEIYRRAANKKVFTNVLSRIKWLKNKSVIESISSTIENTNELISENDCYNILSQEYSRRYPWLRFHDPYTGESKLDADIYIYDYPDGWKKAFGELWLEDMNQIIREDGLMDSFSFLQIKEKYGQLRVYTNSNNPKIKEVVDAYATISKNVCIDCGKLDVPLLSNIGWISPYCKECYEYDNDTALSYFEASKDKRSQITEEYHIRCGKEEYAVDISEYVAKVRNHNR